MRVWVWGSWTTNLTGLLPVWSCPPQQVNKMLLGECLYRKQRCLSPWAALFVWAVLQNRREMALYFWEMVRHFMAIKNFHYSSSYRTHPESSESNWWPSYCKARSITTCPPYGLFMTGHFHSVWGAGLIWWAHTQYHLLCLCMDVCVRLGSLCSALLVPVRCWENCPNWRVRLRASWRWRNWLRCLRTWLRVSVSTAALIHTSGCETLIIIN